MVGNIKEIIARAQNDLPHAGIVAYDCNLHNVFYTPLSEIQHLRDNLSEQDQRFLDAAQAELSDEESILIITFHNNKVVDITTYDEQIDLSARCPLDN